MEQQIESVVDSILEDYRSGRIIDRGDQRSHPDKDAVADMIARLRRIVFPDRGTDADMVREVFRAMRRQLATASGDGVCLKFFRVVPRVRAMVQTDLQAAFDGDPAAADMEEIILAYPGLFAVTVYRLAHELYQLKVPMLPRMMTEYAHSLTGIDIHPGAVIAEAFFIDHGTGVVIGETTVIGRGVKIYQGVTLGGLSTRGGQSLRGIKRHPTIEDNVTIYANATILGGDTVIGADSVIGANVFITDSVAPGTVVTAASQDLSFRKREYQER